MIQYEYSSEKFSDAVRALMLPHPKGEAESIANAFLDCQNVLHEINRENINDDNVLDWLNKLDNFMSIDELDDPTGRGLFIIKAESLTLDDKIELSTIIYELSSWFKCKFWDIF